MVSFFSGVRTLPATPALNGEPGLAGGRWPNPQRRQVLYSSHRALPSCPVPGVGWRAPECGSRHARPGYRRNHASGAAGGRPLRPEPAHNQCFLPRSLSRSPHPARLVLLFAIPAPGAHAPGSLSDQRPRLEGAQLNFWISAMSGMNRAITMKPTMLPSTMISSGSISLVSPSVSTLTSAS